MSGYDTHKSNPGAAMVADGTTAPADWPAKLRHIGASLLPLGLFAGSVLAYEQVIPPAPAPAQSRPQVAGASPAPKANLVPASKTAALEATPVAAQKTGAIDAASAPAAAPQFEDGRSLLDLSRKAESSRPPAAPSVSQRQISLEAGPSSRAALGFAHSEPLPAGAYATIRGVPANARLTHGLAVGHDTWLVDGADLALVALEMRSGITGAHDLDLSVLSADNRPIAIERIAVAVKASIDAPPSLAAAGAGTVVAAVAQAVSPTVPTTPAFTAPVTPPAPVTIEATAAASAKAIGPLNAPRSLKLAAGTQLEPGRGSFVKFEVAPANDLPDGAYMLLRGLPRDSTLSRGVQVGPDVWLLTVEELKAFEVRVPPRTAGTIKLDAKLVTRLGEVMAETTASLEAGARSGAAVVASTATPSTLVTRSVPAPAVPSAVATPVAPSTPPAPKSQTKATIAEERVAGNPVLARGRKMLAVGNIAVARPLLERAAGEGSGEAAALLGASFDSIWLKRTGAVGIAGDDAAAKRWYDEARRLGTGDIDRIVGTPAARGGPSVTR